ncbi:phospholipase D-like domain-containing protein, partial [Micromonospora chersina]
MRYDEISSIGSANMDFRSFELNFEVNAFIYDEDIAKQLRQAFEKVTRVARDGD